MKPLQVAGLDCCQDPASFPGNSTVGFQIHASLRQQPIFTLARPVRALSGVYPRLRILPGKSVQILFPKLMGPMILPHWEVVNLGLIKKSLPEPVYRIRSSRKQAGQNSRACGREEPWSGRLSMGPSGPRQCRTPRHRFHSIKTISKSKNQFYRPAKEDLNQFAGNVISCFFKSA